MMTERFTTLTGVAVPLEAANVDTDQILPARFLKLSRSEGLGRFLFHDQRFDETGAPRPSFPLNKPRYADACILVAGENFGTGSSREAAVYALFDYGLRCVIAASFASIFFANALRNGLLPVTLDAAHVTRLQRLAGQLGGLKLTIDLTAETVDLPSGERLRFSVPGLQRRCLLTGKGELELTLERMDEIRAFADARAAEHPWLVPLARTNAAGDPTAGGAR